MIDDLLYPAIPVMRCTIHKQGIIIKGCLDPTCRRKVLLCQQCINEDAHMEHNQNVYGIKQFIFELSLLINKNTKDNKQQLDSFLRNEENMKIFKFIQDNKHHLKKVKDNIDTQKTLIAKDITEIIEIVQLELQEIKNGMFKKLDKLYTDYEELFDLTRKNYNIKFFSASNYYFSNPQALSCKIAQLGSSANEEYLKRLRQFTEINIAQLQDSFQQVSKMNAQPFYDSDLQKLRNLIQEPLKNYFDSRLNSSIPQPELQKQRSNSNLPRDLYGLSEQFTIYKSGKNVRFNKSLDLRRPVWIHFKPFKRFTLDFQIGGLLNLSKSSVVMLGQNESKLRLFDIEKKTLISVEGHFAPINLIESISQQQFITGADDGSIFLWQHQQQTLQLVDRFQMTNKGILSALSLQNNSFVFADSEGRIGYKNLTNKTEMYISIFPTISTKLRKFRLALVKTGELFCVYISGDPGGHIIQVSEKDKMLRKISANALPIAPTLIPYSLNEIIIASNQDAKIVPIHSNDFLGGFEVDPLQFEFTLNKISYLVLIPLDQGSSKQYRIQQLDQGKFDIQQKDLILEQIDVLKSRVKPSMQLMKTQDKLQLLVADPVKNALNIFDVNFK